MKKTVLWLLVPLLLSACEKTPVTSSQAPVSSDVAAPSSPDSKPSDSPSSVAPTLPPPTAVVPPSSSAGQPSTIPPSSTPSTGGQEVDRPAYNPDGSKTLERPQNFGNRLDITEWVNLDFSQGVMPDYCRYIYGNNFTQPDFYAVSAGGGLKMNENSKSRKGVQLPYFNSWLKVELRIYIGKLFQGGSQVNYKDPVFTIYGFDENGLIKKTETIDMIGTNNEGGYVRCYFGGEDISYIEIRATNLPYKSSQVYNFSIAKIGLKGWPYPLD